jgi:hypothetical protein
MKKKKKKQTGTQHQEAVIVGPYMIHFGKHNSLSGGRDRTLTMYLALIGHRSKENCDQSEIATEKLH